MRATGYVIGLAAAAAIGMPGCIVVVDNGDDVQTQRSHAETGRIGVELADVSGSTASQAAVDPSRSCMIKSVSFGSAAEKAGLQKYDVVTHIDGRDYATMSALREAVRARRPGETIALTVVRGGKPQDITITCDGD